MAPVHERSRPCRGVEVTAYKQDDAAAISESQGLGIAQTDACGRATTAQRAAGDESVCCEGMQARLASSARTHSTAGDLFESGRRDGWRRLCK